jgi:hypothetical protein
MSERYGGVNETKTCSFTCLCGVCAGMLACYTKPEALVVVFPVNGRKILPPVNRAAEYLQGGAGGYQAP